MSSEVRIEKLSSDGTGGTDSGGISLSTIIASILAILLVREQVIKIPKWMIRYAQKGFDMIFMKSKIISSNNNDKSKRNDDNNNNKNLCTKTLKNDLPMITINNNNDSNSNKNDLTTTSENNNNNNDDGIHDLFGFATRLSNLMKLADKQVKEATQKPLDGMKFKMAAITMLKTITDIRDKDPNSWSRINVDSGTPIILSDAIRESMIHILHITDWAYLDETDEIRTKVEECNMYLLRHVKSDSPGRVCHYVAMDVTKKIIYISIKGTSNLSDAVTDACGLPAVYELPGPFINHTTTTNINKKNSTSTTGTTTTSITCHSGILDASIHFVDDIQPLILNLFLPCGYKIILVGHSLGAGVACIAGVILRARIPQLQINQKDTFEVIAFATPPVMNYTTAIETAIFTTSFVNNFDIVPRCSMWTVVSFMSLLEYVNGILEKKGFLCDNLPQSLDLLLKLREDTETTILTIEELYEGLFQAREKFDTTDPNYLFVPGEVIIMYEVYDDDDNNNNNNKTDNNNNNNTDISADANANAIDDAKTKNNNNKKDKRKSLHVAAILTDGSAPVLGHICPETTMVGDHMCNAYEASLKALWK